jgi:preprotein translocase subunit SecE
VADSEKPADQSRDATEPNDDAVESGDEVVESQSPSSNGLTGDRASDRLTEDGAANGLIEHGASSGLIEDGASSGLIEDGASNGLTEDGASRGGRNGDAGPLVSVGAPRRRSPSAATGSTAPVKAGRESKGRPTPSQRRGPAKKERTGPVQFVRESVGELRKVVYPTGQQVLQYFVVVLVFVLFVIAYVSLLDLGFGTAIFKIFS